MEVDADAPTDKKGNVLSQYEREKAELDAAPMIRRHEYSPAAFIFQPSEEEA